MAAWVRRVDTGYVRCRSCAYSCRESWLWQQFLFVEKIKRMGLVRFELTIDGSLRTLEEFKENTKSVLQRLLTDRPRRAGLSRPVAHHFIRWSPSPFLTRPQPLVVLTYVFMCVTYFRRMLRKHHTSQTCYWPE